MPVGEYLLRHVFIYVLWYANSWISPFILHPFGQVLHNVDLTHETVVKYAVHSGTKASTQVLVKNRKPIFTS